MPTWRASRTVATIATDVPVDIELEGVEFGTFDERAVTTAFGELRFTTLLERVLNLGGTGASEEHEDRAVPEEPTASSEDVLTGEAARTAVAQWATGASGWVGAAVDDGSGESLFPDRLDLGVALGGASALVTGEEASVALEQLIRSGYVAAASAKDLLQRVCPPDETAPCSDALESMDPARLFDVGVAAYLLESGRSSFDVGGLCADYLGRPLPVGSEAMPLAVAEARAVNEIAAILESRLAEDGSEGVFREIEMPLVPVLVRMERVGVGVDTAVLAELAEESARRIDELRAEIYELAGCEFSVDSPKQLAEVLFDRLGLPPQKRTKTGYSTDASVLAALGAIHPIAEKVVGYRELTKLKSTYIDALPRLLGEDGRLHTSFNQTVAATGRLSSSNPNLQNIPVRTEFGRRIRAAFVPSEPGGVMVSADYSQIELRILAHLSGDAGLIEAFTSGADFHSATAARVFGVSPDDVPPALRSRAKAVNFGIVYGQTAHGLAESLQIPHNEAQEMIDRYYAAYSDVRRFLDDVVADAHRTGSAATMFGRKRRIPELRSGNHSVRAFGERTAMNHPMQGTAADIMKLAMIEVDRGLRESGLAARMVLQVHDELVFECAESELQAVTGLARDAMRGVVGLRVPIEVSVAHALNWAEAK
jgi:DNA polymerase-1